MKAIAEVLATSALIWACLMVPLVVVAWTLTALGLS